MEQKGIGLKQLDDFQARWTADPANAVAANAVARVGIREASLDNNVLRRHPFTFSDEVQGGKITNQKASGRCWMFSALNTARVDTMEKLNVEDFEFSANYTLFFDKLEKSNTFLENIIETREEARDSRIVWHLLQDPLGDGGQWDMFAALLEKYGAVPSSVMPETFHSSNTRELVTQLTYKLHEYACVLREAFAEGENEDQLRKRKDDMLYYVWQVLVKALGEPPVKFDYAWRDKDKAYHRLTDVTPQDFFRDYVGWKLGDKISLINAPTDDKPYGKAYTVQYLSSVYDGRQVRYLNVPIELLKEAAIRQIQDGKPVWFGCDVGKQSTRDSGIMDEHAYAYELTLGDTDNLTRAQRLDYSSSMLTHAMVFLGVDLDESGKAINWKVENSWGEKPGRNGIFSMSDKWFDEYCYQIMVDRSYVPDEYLAAYDSEETVVLKPWDPMGSLAMVQ